MRHLYACLTLVALGLAVVLLWTAFGTPGVHPNSWVRGVGSPILIVPNDVAFLAVIAPFALAVERQQVVLGEPELADGRVGL